MLVLFNQCAVDRQENLDAKHMFMHIHTLADMHRCAVASRWYRSVHNRPTNKRVQGLRALGLSVVCLRLCVAAYAWAIDINSTSRSVHLGDAWQSNELQNLQQHPALEPMTKVQHFGARASPSDIGVMMIWAPVAGHGGAHYKQAGREVVRYKHYVIHRVSVVNKGGCEPLRKTP